jgi:hypothetical protein
MAQTSRRTDGNMLLQQCSPRQFRERAAQCFRLAGAITDESMVEQLRRIGAEFEARAVRLEAGF